MIYETLLSGFSLGLLTGSACFATCGPIYMPYMMQRKLNITQSVFMILEISAGRFVSYILFGIAAGFLGQSISSISEHKELFTAIAYIAFSVMLLMSAFSTQKKETGCAVSKWSKFADAPVLLGIFTGINFCPSFLIALTNAVSLNGPVSGAVLFFGFFMGTNIYLLPLSVFGVMGNKKVFRTIAMAASILVGGFFIVKAVTTLMHFPDHEAPQVSGENIVSILDKDDMFVLKSPDENIEILINALKKKRKGVVKTITSETEITDSCYVLVTTGYDSLVIDKAKSMLKPFRFVIVLPEIDSTQYSKTYSENVIKYLNKYYFKKDTVHGTFFNMSRFKESKVKGK